MGVNETYERWNDVCWDIESNKQGKTAKKVNWGVEWRWELLE